MHIFSVVNKYKNTNEIMLKKRRETVAHGFVHYTRDSIDYYMYVILRVFDKEASGSCIGRTG